MSSVRAYLDRRFYPDYSSNWDDNIFRKNILAALDNSHCLLDVGAGAGIVEQMDFRGKAQRVCGIDLDPRVMDNPFLDEARLASGSEIPYPENTFDVVVSDNVLEHLEDPASVFAEVLRVLRPGGVFLFKTPNKFHYMPLIARFTPHRFHQFVNKLRGRDETDTFPTLYRANSRSDVRRLAQRAGFRVDQLETLEGRPEYLRMFAPLYLIGILYERLVNAHRRLEPFRILLVGRLCKPVEP